MMFTSVTVGLWWHTGQVAGSVRLLFALGVAVRLAERLLVGER
ncbi:hypothetical protein [Nakamurella antarctica]|nr:hypothetical protein [Nakamurella antarctica]